MTEIDNKKNKEDIKEKNSDIDLDKENLEDQEKNNFVNETNKETVKDFEEENLKLSEDVEKLREEKLRILAEMENFRKRAEKEKKDTLKFGNMNFARDVLSVNDNLTRALDNLPEDNNSSDSIKNLLKGLDLVQRELETMLNKHGVKKIDALNEKFNHNFHQAMLEIESDNHDENTIIQEIQLGYMIHDRLLRPSMVGVSKKINKKDKK